jgi:hypothetical protein
MSQSTASALLRYAAELRDTIRHEWAAERKHPDRAPYHRGRRKIVLQRAVNALQYAREELQVEKSPRSHLFEMDMEWRRGAHREAAE